MIQLIPLGPERLQAITADPGPALAGLCSNTGVVAGVIAAVAEATLHLQGRTGTRAPWIGYLARYRADGTVVGACGFKGPPADRTVEIAYFTFPGYERRGYASEMAEALIGLAFRDAAIEEVIAHTRAGESPSTRVLRRLRFRFAGVSRPH